MKLQVLDFTIGTTHTISLGNFENIKVEASISVGVPVECTDEQFFMLRQEAQTKLKEILRETYLAQKRNRTETHRTEPT